MTDPVNVRIARFVGWAEVQKLDGREKWVGIRPCAACGDDGICDEHDALGPSYDPIPDFEHDWSAAGPLLARFGIAIAHSPHDAVATAPWKATFIQAERQQPDEADILPAVCRVVLTLAEREQEKRA